LVQIGGEAAAKARSASAEGWAAVAEGQTEAL